VTAIDFSVAFIDLCKKRAPEYPIPEGHELRAIVGDAHDLVSEEPYDLVVAVNLIDRMETPQMFLDGVKPLLSEKGILIVTSPYTWMEKFTDKSKWLGGFQKWGEAHTTLHGLREALAPELTLLGEPEDIPFVIPDPDGAFQYTLAHASVYRRM
jgi:spermidine synthase